MKKRFIFPLLIALGCAACRKEQTLTPQPIDYTVLPPATQEGKNTFGCLVGGGVWVPRVELFVPWFDKAASLHEKNLKGSGSIVCRIITGKQDEFMQITFGPTYFQKGAYYSSSILGHPTSTAMFRTTTGDYYHSEGKDSLSNWVKISSIDTTRNLIAGTFRFVLYKNKDRNDYIKLTDGRFDMPYYPE